MSAVDEYSATQRAAGNGTFKVKDDKTGEELDPGATLWALPCKVKAVQSRTVGNRRDYAV
jgi:hypothetical protein